jgi:hypothetical protein
MALAQNVIVHVQHMLETFKTIKWYDYILNFSNIYWIGAGTRSRLNFFGSKGEPKKNIHFRSTDIESIQYQCLALYHVCFLPVKFWLSKAIFIIYDQS